MNFQGSLPIPEEQEEEGSECIDEAQAEQANIHVKTSLNQETEEASTISTESSEPVRQEMETDVQTLTESISIMNTEASKSPATTSTITSQTELSRDHPENEESMPEQIRQ